MRIERGLNGFESLEKKDEKIELKRKMEIYYDSFPKRREVGNSDSSLAKELTLFLIDKEYITEVQKWNSWGCKYEDGVIFINEQEIPQEKENYYIFRLGENQLTGEHLFPKIGDGVGGEVDTYRFLHETNHAYQDWRKDEDNSERWFEDAISKSVKEKTSPMERIFKFCYEKRKEQGFGLSTWGNVPDYDYRAHPEIPNIESEVATRAWEDVNELSTMYLWHPEYLNTFLEYLSGNIDGYGNQDLKEDKLVRITEEEKKFLQKNILQYIEEMKENIRQKNIYSRETDIK
jgi:hypothetical protein